MGCGFTLPDHYSGLCLSELRKLIILILFRNVGKDFPFVVNLDVELLFSSFSVFADHQLLLNDILRSYPTFGNEGHELITSTVPGIST